MSRICAEVCQRTLAEKKDYNIYRERKDDGKDKKNKKDAVCQFCSVDFFVYMHDVCAVTLYEYEK